MALIAMVSGKGSPGATTSVAVLATVWPTPVVVADCDPTGGDLAIGWLSPWWVQGWLRTDRGVLSFATATRHATVVDPGLLAEHLQTVPSAPHARLLVGLSRATQAAAVTETGWHHLARALTDLRQIGSEPVDVLVDCGRYGPATPWPLLLAADLVLLAVRPHPRHILAARPVVDLLHQHVAAERLGIAVCATTGAGITQTEQVLGLRCGLALPVDTAAARMFSDGIDPPGTLGRSPLVTSARKAARHLHTAFTPEPSARSAPARMSEVPGEIPARAAIGARS